jgi:NDP-sugar pyrophosphorylase family protein
MAGRGSRFQQEGYSLPKPLIAVNGRPMIKLVIENISPKTPHRFVFLCLKEHIDCYHIDDKLRSWTGAGGNTEIVVVDRVTEGAACTVLLAKDLINNSDPLMIANSDQWIDSDINDYLAFFDDAGADGLIMTMRADDPKWSYVALDGQGRVTGVYEKEVVSAEATVGIYNFRHGEDFVNAAETMINNDLRVNNEFYVAPVYNVLIAKGAKIAFYNIGSECNGMYGLGTPKDLEIYLARKSGTDL